MKIAIVGPGALGCLLAALFFRAGEEVVLVDYRPERVGLLRRQGVELQTLAGERHTLRVPDVLPDEAGPADLTIMAVKAHQTGAAALNLPRLMAAGGLALTLQNGLGNLEAMAKEVGPSRLLGGVAYLGVTRREEGHIIYAGRGPTYIGAPPGSKVSPPEIATVVERFLHAGLECHAHPDIQALLWEKLMINVGINPLTALLRVPNGALPELPEAWELAVAAAAEAQQVARAAGLTVPHDPAGLLERVCTATAANRSSMLQDILAGRPTEIEALNAQVTARGQTLGIPTPVNHLLTQLLRALGQSATKRVG
jgi:2-dehydropantoate 2-reductase